MAMIPPQSPISLPGAPRALALPPKATRATMSQIVGDKLTKPIQAVPDAWSALAYGNTKDNKLARMDDTMRMLGTIGIATAGSLNVPQVGGSLPLWLGAASWIGAQAITPALINATIRLKTGVPLNTKYINSNGDVKPLFQDPGYIPLQVIPLPERLKMVGHLDIPFEHPDRPTLLLDKVRQIGVQAHTWWMLMAGIATPVLSSVICDRVEEHGKDWLSSLRQGWAYRRHVTPALKANDAEAFGKAMEHTVKTVMGKGTEVSPMSRWWRSVPLKISKALNLSAMDQKLLLEKSTSDAGLREALAKHIYHVLEDNGAPGNVKRRAALLDTLNHLEAWRKAELDPLRELLKNPLLNLDKRALLEQTVALDDAAAEGTLRQFKQLLERPAHGATKALAINELEHSLTKPVQGYVMDWLNHNRGVATRLAGGPEALDKMVKEYLAQRFESAFKHAGSTPMESLLNAGRSLGLRRRWLMRYPIALGGFMAVSTLLYTAIFVGRDFKFKSEGKS